MMPENTQGYERLTYVGVIAIVMVLSLSLITPMQAFAGPYTGGYPNKSVIHNIDRVTMNTDLAGTDYNALDCVIKSVYGIAGTTGSAPSGWTYLIGVSLFKNPICASSGDYYGRAEVWNLSSLYSSTNIASPYDRTTLDDVDKDMYWSSDRTKVTFKFTFRDAAGNTQIKTWTYWKAGSDSSNNFMNGVTNSDGKLIKFMQYGAEGTDAYPNQDGWNIKQKDMKFYTTSGGTYDLKSYYNYAVRHPDAWITYRDGTYILLGSSDSTHTQADYNAKTSLVPKGQVVWYYVSSNPILSGTLLWSP